MLIKMELSYRCGVEVVNVVFKSHIKLLLLVCLFVIKMNFKLLIPFWTPH